MSEDHHPDGRRRSRKPANDAEGMSLFDFAATPKETRRDAFIASKSKLSKRCEAVLRFIKERGDIGATMSEASEGTGVLYQSMSSVFGDLKARELLRHNGEKRPTPTGNLAAVAVAVEGSGGC